MVNFTLRKNLKTYKNGCWSPVFVCYILSMLPVIIAFLYAIFNIFNSTNFNFLYQHLQFSYWLIIFPILFIVIDITRVLNGKYKIKFAFKDLVKTYPETSFLLSALIWIIIGSFYRLLSGIAPSGFEAKALSIFNIYQGLPVFLFYGMCFLFAFLLKSRNITKNILVSTVVCSSILVAFSLIDPTGKISFQSMGNTNWCSVFFNSNYYGYYLSITTILCFGLFLFEGNKIVKWLFFSTGTLHILVCLLNNSLACMLSVFVVLILLPIIVNIKNRQFDLRTLLPLAVFIALSQFVLLFSKHYYSNYQNFFLQLANMAKEVVYFLQDPSAPQIQAFGTGRVGLWIESLKEICKNPIFGNGKSNTLPHSEYLQIAELWGLPCLTLFLVAIIMVFIKAFKFLKELDSITIILMFTCLSYLISASFGNIMPHITYGFSMLLGLFIRWLNVDVKKAKLQKEIQTEGIIITDKNVL